jgi:hypothetical protein
MTDDFESRFLENLKKELDEYKPELNIGASE